VADGSHGTAQLEESIDRLAAIDWSRSESAHREAARVLEALDAEALLTELKVDLEAMVDPGRSSEKTTHYKWLVDDDPGGRFKLWLHEYKPSELRREGHAAIPHNHRFWLSSVILRGGFTDSRFRRVERPDPQTDWIEPQTSRSMSVGNTMTLAPEEIHALGDLRDGTVSLIVEGEAVRSFSEVFEGGTMRRYYDLEAKLADFRRSL